VSLIQGLLRAIVCDVYPVSVYKDLFMQAIEILTTALHINQVSCKQWRIYTIYY